MASSSVEIPEVMIGGKHVSTEELDDLRDAVCLLKWKSKDKSKQWSGYGFYANVKLTTQGKNINCIITIYDDIFLEVDEHGDDMVAVFHDESDGKEAFELPLVPFKLLAHGKRGATLFVLHPLSGQTILTGQRFDYALIFIDESKMEGKDVKPIVADNSQLAVVQPNDKVYMIHHPGKMKKHYSEDNVTRVTEHSIKYHPNTLEGPPGSPVFVFKDSKFLLIAMHCNNKREGVLVSYILNHLDTPGVLSTLQVPRQNPFVRALSWALSWLSPSFWLAPFMRPTHGHSFHSGQRSAGSVLSWPSFSFRRVPSARTRSILQFPSAETSWSSSDDEDTVKLKRKSEWKPSRSEQITKTFTVDGGAIETDNISLKAGEGCLAENTDIVMERVDHQFDVCKSLLDLGLVHAAPHIVEFSPDSLEFWKPADLKIKFEKAVSDSECFILHGFYNPVYQRIIWELLTNGVEENDAEGVIHAKITSFSFYMFILSTRGKLARIISHLNHSFTCLAYSFYRRSLSMDTIDISVVLVSEFFDDNKENNIKHLLDKGFVEGEKGVLKRVDTDHLLEMSLHFPGIEKPPYGFQVDQSLLDSVGFVIDHFKKIAVTGPANGEVKISEKNREDENESLWILNVIEKNEEIQAEVVPVLEQSPSPEIRPEGQSPSLEPSPVVVNRTTKLTNKEITQMSREVGIDWDNLAALMDIPYPEREEIRINYGKYPSFLSKAEKVLKLFNDSECFDRTTLMKYLEELKRHDVRNKMLPMDYQSANEDVDTGTTAATPPEISEMQLQDDTPLSSREMYTLSRQLVINWDRLAALLGITAAERDDIRYSLLYTKSHSKAEKMLAIFNNMEDFSRKKLAECLEEIDQLKLKEPVITGEWRR